MEKVDTLVLYPLYTMGHLIPMVELAKHFLRHGLSVNVIFVQLPFLNNEPIDTYISNVEASHPSISFHRLPTTTLPSPSSSISANLFEIIHLSNPHLLHYLRSSSSIRALILDFFSGPALDVAAEMQLPTYIFSPVNASTLSAMLYIPTLHSQSDTSFKDIGDAPVHFPGLSYPIPASYILSPLLDRADEAYKVLVASFERSLAAKAILVNSFEALEAQVLRALADGVCVQGRAMAPVYCVGPITASGVKKSGSEPRHESLVWLDGQPSGSVVFLCFGSVWAFSEAQLREIAAGLERSEQRFLWVVRGPPIPGTFLWTEPDLEALMPEGFEERTRERGLVVRSWAPQVEVLGHESVGGFVTHSGWNSVLESVVAGVPMIAWPLYAEQKMNKLFLVEEAGLAVDMRGDENGFVGAEEVEERVRWLMDTESGRELKGKVADVGKKARDALRDGGTSHTALAEIVRSLRRDEDGGRPVPDE